MAGWGSVDRRPLLHELPGAKRIVSSTTADKLLRTAFLNLDGAIAVIVMNETALELPLLLSLREKTARTNLPAHSIMTVVIP
jgi:glucosylceramidase